MRINCKGRGDLLKLSYFILEDGNFNGISTAELLRLFRIFCKLLLLTKTPKQKALEF